MFDITNNNLLIIWFIKRNDMELAAKNILVDKNITDKNRTLGPLACTFLSVFFLSVHILSLFRMGPKFFQIFAPSLIKTVDYYKVLLLMFIGI